MAYLYSRLLTVDRTKCGSSNLSSFPVLVSITHSTLKTVANGGHVNNTTTQASPAVTMPADLVFATDTAGNSKIPWEIQSYDATNGILLAWVNVSTVNGSGAGSNSTFYIVYGDSSVTTAQNTGSFTPQLTWNSNYKAIWHLNEATNAQVKDSSSSAFNSTTNVCTHITSGKFGNGLSFNGTTEKIVFPSVFTTQADFTISAWIKATTANYGVILDCRAPSANGSLIYVLITTGKAANFFNPPSAEVDSTATASDGTWHYVVATRSGNTSAIYVDNNAAVTSVIVANSNWGSDARIGEDYTNILYPSSNSETRVSNIARPADWITTEYNNQNAPGNIGADNFIIFGSEVSSSVITSRRTFSGNLRGR